MDSLARVPLNDLSRYYHYFKNEIQSATANVLTNGVALNGLYNQRFSSSFAQYVGAKFCHCVANGTDALELALKACALSATPSKTEVILAPNCGGYSSTAIFGINLVPVYADICPTTHLIDLDSILSCVNSSTLAVVATHLFGGMVDVARLKAMLNERGFHDVFIVEDCAQAHGLKFGGFKAGSLGDIAAFSFYPTKNLGGFGDAGAVVSSSLQLHDYVKYLSQYGWSDKYTVAYEYGQNSRMDEVQAAILESVLKSLDKLNDQRKHIASLYSSVAPGSLIVQSTLDSVFHLFVIKTKSRERFQAHMNMSGIDTGIHYPLLDPCQPAWRAKTFKFAPKGIPEAIKQNKMIVTLPCFPFMSDQEVERVCNALAAWTE